jgi:hypothetical protein
MIDLLTPAEIRALGSAFAKVARRLDDEQQGEVA